MGESEHAHRQNANGTFNSRKAAHGGWSAVACHNSRDTTRRPDCCATVEEDINEVCAHA